MIIDLTSSASSEETERGKKKRISYIETTAQEEAKPLIVQLIPKTKLEQASKE